MIKSSSRTWLFRVQLKNELKIRSNFDKLNYFFGKSFNFTIEWNKWLYQGFGNSYMNNVRFLYSQKKKKKIFCNTTCLITLLMIICWWKRQQSVSILSCEVKCGRKINKKKLWKQDNPVQRKNILNFLRINNFQLLKFVCGHYADFSNKSKILNGPWNLFCLQF